MKKIVCGASYPRKFKIGAWLISWWEETLASHVYVCLKRESGIHLLYQAVGSGVEFKGYSLFIKENSAVYEKEVEISDAAFNKLIDKLIPKLKTKYSKKHLLGLFWKRLLQYWFKKVVKNPFKDGDKSAVCVEALCDVLNATKDELPEITDLIKIVDPEDMGMFEAMQLLKKLPGKELVS